MIEHASERGRVCVERPKKSRIAGERLWARAVRRTVKQADIGYVLAYALEHEICPGVRAELARLIEKRKAGGALSDRDLVWIVFRVLCPLRREKSN
jgi:hypothetical protein